MVQGYGGLMSITGESDEAPGGGPQKVGVAVADLMTGMYATSAVLAALFERERSGLGQHLDIALLDCQLAMLANQSMNYLTSGIAPRRFGNAHPNVVPYQTFAASDGHLIIAVGNDSQFRALCEALGFAELGRDSRFATNTARSLNRTELLPQLAEIIHSGSRDDWIERLRIAGVPCGPINDIAQAFGSEQAQHRQVVQRIPHPRAGSTPVVANPMRLSDTPVQYRTAPPLLGEHTVEVLRERLGLDQAAIDALEKSGVVSSARPAASGPLAAMPLADT
jgi:formyl-CoA transferase